VAAGPGSEVGIVVLRPREREGWCLPQLSRCCAGSFQTLLGAGHGQAYQPSPRPVQSLEDSLRIAEKMAEVYKDCAQETGPLCLPLLSPCLRGGGGGDEDAHRAAATSG